MNPWKIVVIVWIVILLYGANLYVFNNNVLSNYSQHLEETDNDN